MSRVFLLAVTVANFAFAADDFFFRMNNYNFAGNDYSSSQAYSPEHCRDKCKQQQGTCRVAAFAGGQCWLKKNVNNEGGQYEGVTTFIQFFRFAGFDMPNYDIRWFQANSLAHCLSECAKDGGCAAVTHRPSDNFCWLKNFADINGRRASFEFNSYVTRMHP